MKTEETFFAGTITEILDPVLYEIKVDIPGVIGGVKAFPIRGEVDEPRVGDFVLLLSLDPVYHSYYLYKKIKENDFIGFRSNGKMVDIIFEGVYFTKLLFIISDKNEEISDSIEKNVKRGVTGLYGKGMYSDKDKLVLICAASRGDIYKIKKLAKEIDEKCFIVVANAREVLGEGFKQ